MLTHVEKSPERTVEGSRVGTSGWWILTCKGCFMWPKPDLCIVYAGCGVIFGWHNHILRPLLVTKKKWVQRIRKQAEKNLSEYSFSFVYCYFAFSIPSRIANLQRFEVWVIVPGYGQLMYQFPKWYEMSFTQRELRSWLVLQTALLAILNPGSNSVVMRSRFGVFWLTFRNK